MTQPPEGDRALREETYSSDAPVSVPTEDQFERWPFAERIAHVLAERRDPASIVVGIYGPWGSGKTSALRLIHHALRQRTDVVVVPFNPWRFGDEDQVLRAFFAALSAALERSLTRWNERIGGIFRTYGKPLAAVMGSPEAAEGAADILGVPDLEELRDRVGTFLREEGKRVVVLVDDIDRLPKDEIHALFRLIKLTADFENTSYVLAFDEEVVSAALQERYGSGRSDAGRSFLEKIVQVPLHLPPPDHVALRLLCFNGVDQALSEAQIELAHEQAREFARLFSDGLEVRLRTPRAAKLYANILTFSLPILKGEVHPVDLMLIEGMRVFYPNLYALLRDNPQVALGKLFDLSDDQERKREIRRADIEPGLADLDAREREAATKLLKALFPQLQAVFGNLIYGPESEQAWARDQRIASREYYTRYFTYAVIRRDAPDQVVRDIVAAAEHLAPEDLRVRLSSSIRPENADAFITKLRRYETDITPQGSRSLAVAVASAAGLFPNPNVMFSFLQPYAQAAMLISNLITKLEDSAARVDLAKRVIEAADSLEFATESYRWFPKYDDERPDPAAFTAEQNADIGATLVSRIRQEASDKLDLLQSEGAAAMLHIWHRFGPAGELTRRLEESLSRDPARALPLLDAFVGTAWSSGGAPHKSDFRQNGYDSLSTLLSPDVVEAALRAHFGPVYQVPEVYPYRSEAGSPSLALAQQFALIHARVRAQQPTEGDGSDCPEDDPDQLGA